MGENELHARIYLGAYGSTTTGNITVAAGTPVPFNVVVDQTKFDVSGSAAVVEKTGRYMFDWQTNSSNNGAVYALSVNGVVSANTAGVYSLSGLIHLHRGDVVALVNASPNSDILLAQPTNAALGSLRLVQVHRE
ncbi:MAG: hypothetical protein ACYCOU_12190 [Sulfobacillus sp.]